MGPSVRFTVRYSHREAFQPATFTYSNFGPKWTCDWIAYITDYPQSPAADVNYYYRGGGTRTFTGFDTKAQTYAYQQYDQTRLTRTAPDSYEMLWPDGSKLVFGQPDGSVGTSRKVFLTQVVDPFGNAVSLSYDVNLRLTAITDAIGQVTTLTYGLTNDLYKITQVTDPFGRFASFSYDSLGRLTAITDLIGLTSQFNYATNGDFINALVTPYGTNTFTAGESGTTRSLETVYADGSRDRVEFNDSPTLIPGKDPASTVPQGMLAFYDYLNSRNTFYWSRNACALGYGDYTKAKLYHWLHSEDIATCSGILESTKEPLESRVFYDYLGQPAGFQVGLNNRPLHVGRVLDDGSTQLYTYGYNGFGNLTNMVDPVGRTFSYLYASNGIDLLEVRMTRAGKNELLGSAIYNARHLPLSRTDAAGQTTIYTYNPRGQLVTETNPKHETVTYKYDTNGYLVAVDGPLPGPDDTVTVTYDSFGRVRTKTDVSGYTVAFEYDAADRITRIVYPDATAHEIVYNRLDPVVVQDRAGRRTLLQYDALRQLAKRTDPLRRVTQFQWCSCGDVKSITDPLGRTTTWHQDVQGRLIRKQFGDGSQITYAYEANSSRLILVTDEKLQTRAFRYNQDNTLRSIGYGNCAVPTPAVSYAYDPDYPRRVSMTDGLGTTVYTYIPITTPSDLGAGQLLSVDGPLPHDTITYGYDELGRRVTTAIEGVAAVLSFDATGRRTAEQNALGSFSYLYDGSSGRLVQLSCPNGQTSISTYGDILHDLRPQRITHRLGTTPVSELQYSYDIPAGRITTWSQQSADQAPELLTLGYDDADQLVSAAVTQGGSLLNTMAYAYDLAGNRVLEIAGGLTNLATYNALDQLSTLMGEAHDTTHTNEWDGADRLAAVTVGNVRTELSYDGLGRLASVRQLTNGVEISLRWLVWCEDKIAEERDSSGVVTKRFFDQGLRLETGVNAGSYFYTRDHLGSVREVIDGSGRVRARYAYEPFGRRTRLEGDLDADFGFAGRFRAAEAGVDIARYRAYSAGLGRWLSRDPARDAEIAEGPNLYAYAANNPVNWNDLLGLCCEKEKQAYDKGLDKFHQKCLACRDIQYEVCKGVSYPPPRQQVRRADDAL